MGIKFDRWISCLGNDRYVREIDLGIVIGTSLIYLSIFLLAFRKHGQHIVKRNKFLLISWSVEAVLSVAATAVCLNHGIES